MLDKTVLNLISFPWKGKGAILMYHRVLPDNKIDTDLDLGMVVSTSNFEQQMRAIKSKYKICSIDEFVENSEKNIFVKDFCRGGVIVFETPPKKNQIAKKIIRA